MKGLYQCFGSFSSDRCKWSGYCWNPFYFISCIVLTKCINSLTQFIKSWPHSHSSISSNHVPKRIKENVIFFGFVFCFYCKRSFRYFCWFCNYLNYLDRILNKWREPLYGFFTDIKRVLRTLLHPPLHNKKTLKYALDTKKCIRLSARTQCKRGMHQLFTLKHTISIAFASPKESPIVLLDSVSIVTALRRKKKWKTNLSTVFVCLPH